MLLHGGSFTGRSWANVTERLPEWRCLTPDLPGHGESQHRPLVSLNAAADDLAELIEKRFDGEPLNIVGLSLGGYIGLSLMARHPRLVRRALLSGIHIGAMPYAGAMVVLMNLMSPFMASRWFRERNARMLGVTDFTLVSNSDGSANVSAATARAIGRLVAVFDVEETLGLIKTPTLAVAGGCEHASILHSLKTLETRMPDCVAKVVPGMGHGWCVADPDLFAQCVHAWFSGEALPQQLVDGFS